MNVLILDDAERTDLVFMEKAAAALGFDVQATSDPAVFRAAARDRKADIQIVDVKFPELKQRVGCSNGPELVALAAAENTHVPTVFLTNFKGDCDRLVSGLDPRLIATTIEKPASASPTDWRDRLDEAIATIKAKPDFDQPKQLGVQVSQLASSFFRLSPREAQALSEGELDELEIDTTKELHPHMKSAWEVCDADWMMLQRIDGSVLVTDRGHDKEIPSLKLIRHAETDRDSPALIIGRPRVIEEMNPTAPVDCTPSSNHRDWRRFPFVRLIVGSEAREFHLDTGSCDSYISREFLDSAMSIPSGPSKKTVVSDLDGKEEVLNQLPVYVELHVSGPQGNTALSVLLQAVKNWQRLMLLNPKCRSARCPGSAKGQCGRRMGLIGRDILYSVEGAVWHFDSRTGQLYAVPPGT
jgi:FixJ family two-component response regulator